jgi:hypothetical protein
MTEQVSGKLPIEPERQRVRSRQDAPTTPEEIEGMAARVALPDAEVSARLGTAARDWALQVSAAADVFVEFARKLAEISDRLAEKLGVPEEVDSDGDGTATG